jgi:LmbE family N-acetylglucosaminyl deacetylase
MPVSVAARPDPVVSSLYVAPHPDDVALSCGGQVAIDARDASPLIVTVFAGDPSGAETDFARMQHERWGVTAASVAEARRAEDRCAAAALGERVDTAWLDFLDAIYRNPAYDSDEALFGALLPEDEPTIAAVVDALAAFGRERIHVPLGIGNHVDHQIAFRAGQELAARGAEVWAYADLPYDLAEHATRPAVTLGDVRLTSLDDDAWHRRAAAIDCYPSQLPVIFRDWGDHRTAIDHYLRRVGGGPRAEVCWRVLALS